MEMMCKKQSLAENGEGTRRRQSIDFSDLFEFYDDFVQEESSINPDQTVKPNSIVVNVR